MDRRTFIGISVAATALVGAKASIAEDRYIILPDITRCERCTKTIDANAITLHYEWMSRFDKVTKLFETAHVNTRRYREWLVGYSTETGLPPHIQFGGAVKGVPGGDQTFHARWLANARTTFL